MNIAVTIGVLTLLAIYAPSVPSWEQGCEALKRSWWC